MLSHNHSWFMFLYVDSPGCDSEVLHPITHCFYKTKIVETAEYYLLIEEVLEDEIFSLLNLKRLFFWHIMGSGFSLADKS